jgi:hypothetical protein
MSIKVKVIRADGAEEDHTLEQASMSAVKKLMGVEITDTVNLRNGTVMLVDDDGWNTEEQIHESGVTLKPTTPKKPINAKATILYRSVTRPGHDHQIVGDVAIVTDADFA